MEFDKIIQLTVTQGLGVAISVIFIITLVWMLRYVLKANTSREERYANIIENHLTSINDKVIQQAADMAAAFKNIERANEYKREEHKQITDILKEVADELRNIRCHAKPN